MTVRIRSVETLAGKNTCRACGREPVKYMVEFGTQQLPMMGVMVCSGCLLELRTLVTEYCDWPEGMRDV